MYRWTAERFRRIRRTCRGSGLATALGAALLFSTVSGLSGCSLLLPFDVENLPCDAGGGCLTGYFCNEASVCEKEPEARPCQPACGELEVCQRGACVATCAGRACPAGQVCNEDAGACEPTTLEGSLGAPCRNHSDCRQFYGDAFCMRPWGDSTGAINGVCTRPCDPENMTDCGTLECATFPSGSRTVSLCADPSFMPCEAEGDCTASGLSCGVHSALSSGAGSANVPVMACRARTKGAEIGNRACTSPEDCVTGLCIHHGGNAICTTPCADIDSCADTLGEGNYCLDVLLDEKHADGQPTVRAPLCVPTKKTLLQNCTTNADCSYDAPDCRLLPEVNQMRCTTPCHNGACPAGSTCKQLPAGSDWANYCGMP